MIGIVYIIWVLDQFYIGSTWDFDDRKSGHNCNMKTSNYKLYIAIRANDNKFVMLVHHEFICENKRELEMEEQNLIDELQPTLNERRAYNSEEYEKERKIEYSKKYYEEISKEHYEENKIEILEKMKQCRIYNPDKYKLLSRVFHLSHVIKIIYFE